MVAPGDCFYRPSGQGLHLHVVVLGPVVLPGYGSRPQIVAVPICTLRLGIPHDDACVLSPGAHPFVKVDSYISYRHACVESEDHAVAMLAKGVWTVHEASCSPDVLQRVVDGLCRSRLVPRIFKQLMGCV